MFSSYWYFLWSPCTLLCSVNSRKVFKHIIVQLILLQDIAVTILKYFLMISLFTWWAVGATGWHFLCSGCAVPRRRGWILAESNRSAILRNTDCILPPFNMVYLLLLDLNGSESEQSYYNCGRIADLFCLMLSLKFQLEETAFCSDKTSQLVRSSNGQAV